MFLSLPHLNASDRGIVDVEMYSKHLQDLNKDMEVRFQDVV